MRVLFTGVRMLLVRHNVCKKQKFADFRISDNLTSWIRRMHSQNSLLNRQAVCFLWLDRETLCFPIRHAAGHAGNVGIAGLFQNIAA